ncbi:MAG: cysteine hydrolase family protein [Vulcanimicrobiota bacterium]
MSKIIKNTNDFIEKNRSFIEYLGEWESKLEEVELAKLVEEAGGAENVAIASVDMIEGFCRLGPLASPRVEAIINEIATLFRKAKSLGINNFVLLQDAHPENSPEFDNFPPHCIKGTQEAETVREFKVLNFFEEMEVIEKKTISSGIDTDLETWLLAKNIRKIVVVGDCTDLCIYQKAMFARLLANARNLDWEIILPANCVDTYDMPVKTAKKIGAMAHPGDFFHMIFLYHMNLNGITVYKSLK